MGLRTCTGNSTLRNLCDSNHVTWNESLQPSSNVWVLKLYEQLNQGIFRGKPLCWTSHKDTWRPWQSPEWWRSCRWSWGWSWPSLWVGLKTLHEQAEPPPELASYEGNTTFRLSYSNLQYLQNKLTVWHASICQKIDLTVMTDTLSAGGSPSHPKHPNTEGHHQTWRTGSHNSPQTWLL